MAKIIGPLFSMSVSGTMGDIVFDRRGFAYLRKGHRDAKTASQGNYRLAMMVAQRGVKLCGPATRQFLKEATETTTWHGYLMKHLIGPQRSSFTGHLQDYNDPALDQAAWEAAAVDAGLRPILVPYADQAAVSPGAQLFCLASTLYELEIYTNLGRPDNNAEAWKECIVSESGTYTPDPPEEDPPEETPGSDLPLEPDLLLSPVKKLLLFLFVAAACTLTLLFQRDAGAAGLVAYSAAGTVKASAGDVTCTDASGNCSPRAISEEANAPAGPGTLGYGMPIPNANFITGFRAAYFSGLYFRNISILGQDLRGSTLSSRSAAQAYRRVRLRRRILANPHPSIHASLHSALFSNCVEGLRNRYKVGRVPQ